MSLWNRSEQPAASSGQPVTPATFETSPVASQPQQPTAQPTVLAQPERAVAAEEHPLTSTDLTYRYSKERASGVEAGLRHLRARRALADLTDAELGLATVPPVSLYDTLRAELGYPI